MDKVLISLFDRTGNASEPYKKDGWYVKRVDIQTGIDILEWGFIDWFMKLERDMFPHARPQVGIIAMIPCDAYALCGNKHKKSPERKALFEYSQQLVAKTKDIIDYFDWQRLLKFWQIENPMSDIHKHNPWMGKVRLQFDPCDYAGYDPDPNNSRYNKRTWLWGKFNIPEKKRIEPFDKSYPGWKNLGGRSIKTKNLRSITPLGFSYAFFEANN